ncbi:hypothetical protein FIBSPDRAFT_1044461 [Athelia psychrophila]|uniref:Uncharacterized protein n=1 Tax=Athelia psychrophila TaxID=1759441 RepID=A0A166JQB1_9AGAM|nr:hypothetical protein FIBSPDRAFT_1044461 [Fibularhizoctonia sp. CBS 109695]
MSAHEQDRSLDLFQSDISITLPALPGTHWSETLGNQVIPQTSQATEIKDAINGIELALADVERYKNHVQHKLDQLDLHRAKLAAFAFEHKSFVAPIRSLPNDLLSEIFEWSCPLLHKVHDFPVTLALVSRRWKAVALATPAIWANITIGGYYAGRRLRKGSGLQCKMWLNRSAHKPLSVSIIDPQHKDVPEQLISECTRWEYFHCSIGSSKLIQQFCRIQGHLPLLRSLVLQAEIGVVDLEVFEIAPQLREVVIRSWRHERLKLPYHQLTRLCVVHGLPPAKWVEYLRLCPNLITFEAEMGSSATTTFSPGPYFTHGCLRVLKLYGGALYCRAWDEHSPMVRVVLPALQILDLHDDGTMGYSHVGSTQPAVDMVSRSGCVITTLRWSSQIEQDPIIDHLHAFPHLRNLDISLDVGWIPPFLERLTSQNPCASLETLDIFVAGKLAFHEKKARASQHPQPPLSGSWLDSQALVIFLQARRAGPHCLRRIRISDSQCGSFEELCGHPEPPEIQTLRDEGMVVAFGLKEVSKEHWDRGRPYTSCRKFTGRGVKV